MNVRIPRKRDERVYVQQCDVTQSSSSARRTISGVMGELPAGSRMTGNDASTKTWAGVKPRLASSEITEPSERRSSAANSRAAPTTSSSISSVVRT